ncbi:NADPH-dependent ferric siderophore reductase (plasmid) [Rhizobium sp. ACO-34A]|nr:NADPH-dependent ferric siderophore reductase [Rhizobium sp. ACO-34A]
MGGMERLAMEVVSVARPFPSVARVTGRISPTNVSVWRQPNLAVRIEVESPEGQRPVSRVYTIRSFDETESRIEIDFVIHEDDSPAMRWLSETRAGACVHMIGPRPHFLPNYDNGKRIALFADETAIPAVYAILQSWKPGAEGSIFIETADRAAFDDLPDVAGVERHLLLRAESEPAGTTGRLVAAAKALAVPQDWTVWAAGERNEARAIKKYFLEEQELPKENVRVFGYWRKGVSSSEIDRMRLQRHAARSGQEQALRPHEEDIDLPV